MGKLQLSGGQDNEFRTPVEQSDTTTGGLPNARDYKPVRDSRLSFSETEINQKMSDSEAELAYKNQVKSFKKGIKI